MKKLLFMAFVVVIFITGCSKPKGQLVGIYRKSSQESTPLGMVFVQRGSFTMGPNDQSATWSVQHSQKTVSIDAFWMDQTEITNGEYLQFIYWVRDSIVRTNLARNEVEFGVEPEESEFYTLAYDPYDESKDPDTVLNWRTKIPWNARWEYEMDDQEKGIFRAVNSVFYQGAERFDGRQLNAHKMIYSYKWVAYDEAARPGNTFNAYTAAYNGRASVTIDSMYMENGRIVDTVITKQLTSRGDLITRRILNIYPDTMCWMTEFAYSYNEPAMMNYFSHPSYGQFPVVGITWNQADAFANWRTDIYKSAGSMPGISEYRLPSEAEWEYAARGDRHAAMYPWGGPYVRDSKGCFMANFKPMRGNYVEDGYLIPSQVGSFEPNDYGLFDMSGNVAEWTSTVYDNALNAYTLDMNPSYEYHSKKTDPKILKLKIVKGGSWKDIYAALQCGARDKEYENICRPSIGFRCVRSFIGN